MVEYDVQRPSWMKNSHFLILRFLHEMEWEGDRFEAPPVVIGRNTGLHPSSVSNVIGDLVEHELVERIRRGWYRITWRGQAYMNGYIPVEELEQGEDI